MKCTNKCLALLTALAVCFGATGCSDEAIAFSYNPDYKVSAFRISGDTGFETADAFASGLCVVNGDINTDNSAVDMTDATSAGLFDLNIMGRWRSLRGLLLWETEYIPGRTFMNGWLLRASPS